VKFDEEFSEEIRSSSFSSVLAEVFIEKGGIPNFSQQLTIIGQTYLGYDVVDKLASLEAQDNGKFYTPKEDVKIISVKIDTFKTGDTVENTEK
jgi:peptidyl-prolyl cis-trans isomerase B (cyclophilin B)